MASTMYFSLLLGFIIATIQSVAAENPYEWHVERSSVNPLSYTEEENYFRNRIGENPFLTASRRREDCPPNEKFSLCDANCQRTCINYRKPIPCPRRCIWGCVCKFGYIRGPNKKCIKPRDCLTKPNAEALRGLFATLNPLPYTGDNYHTSESVTRIPQYEEATPLPLKKKPDECPPRERMGICNAHCQRTCSNKDEKEIPCRPVCTRGCICEVGLVRGPDGKCIEKEKCPTKSHSEIISENDAINNRRNDGCPNDNECTISCRHYGHRNGHCTGRNSLVCSCYIENYENAENDDSRTAN